MIMINILVIILSLVLHVLLLIAYGVQQFANQIALDLFQLKMSPTLSLYGMYQKLSIYCRNRTNYQ